MKIILVLLLFIQMGSCTYAQDKTETKYLAICQQDKGCEFSEISMPASQVDKLLGKDNFLTSATSNATLILNKCESIIDEKQTLEAIDQMYGGSGNKVALKKIELENYLKENGCLVFSCANETKKISFQIETEGLSGNGYFFLNIKAGEAYMPNDAFQELFKNQNIGPLIIDQLIRNGKMENYVIAEGQKYRVSQPIGINMNKVVENDAINAKQFQNDFKKTGRTRKHLNTSILETEYTGKDDEGRILNIWMIATNDVCLDSGKFDAHGFYNLGYISVDGVTYLITEMNGEGIQIKLTNKADGNYNFNTAGYQTVNLPGLK